MIGVIIMICCCCRKKDSNQKFENKSKYKQGHPSQVQMHQHNTMASNVSSQYEYKKQSHNERDIGKIIGHKPNCIIQCKWNCA